MVDPAEFLEVARSLASSRSPSDAALRRAVSTAYYALFHALAIAAADRMVGAGDRTAAYALIYRGLDHAKVKTVLLEISKPTLRDAYRKALGRGSVSPELQKFADVFVPMQQLRHLADYHPSIVFSPSDARDMIVEAGSALALLMGLDTQERTDVLALMLVGKRIG